MSIEREFRFGLIRILRPMIILRGALKDYFFNVLLNFIKLRISNVVPCKHNHKGPNEVNRSDSCQKQKPKPMEIK